MCNIDARWKFHAITWGEIASFLKNIKNCKFLSIEKPQKKGRLRLFNPQGNVVELLRGRKMFQFKWIIFLQILDFDYDYIIYWFPLEIKKSFAYNILFFNVKLIVQFTFIHVQQLQFDHKKKGIVSETKWNYKWMDAN